MIVLMHVLGNNILVGLPQNVRILHIAQLEEFVPGRSILEELLSADTDRTRIIREAQGKGANIYCFGVYSLIGLFYKLCRVFRRRRHRMQL